MSNKVLWIIGIVLVLLVLSGKLDFGKLFGTFSIYDEYTGGGNLKIKYTINSLSMKDGVDHPSPSQDSVCSGDIKFAPTPDYHLIVCAYNNSGYYGCNHYDVGEIGAGSTIETNPFYGNLGQTLSLFIGWSRIKDPYGHYTHDEEKISWTDAPYWACDQRSWGVYGISTMKENCQGCGPISSCGNVQICTAYNCQGCSSVSPGQTVWLRYQKFHSCKIYEGYIRTGGSDANMNGIYHIVSEKDLSTGICSNYACGWTEGYMSYNTCEWGTPPSCPTQLCKYAQGNSLSTSFDGVTTTTATFTSQIQSTGTIAYVSTCTPKTCSDYPNQYGTLDNGCSGTIQCCNTASDVDCNGIISRDEMGTSIYNWIQDAITNTITALRNIIIKWKGG